MDALYTWLRDTDCNELMAALLRWQMQSLQVEQSWSLLGPTGEHNRYELRPRGTVLCITNNKEDLLLHLSIALCTGNTMLWTDTEFHRHLHATLPENIKGHISLVCADVDIDGVDIPVGKSSVHPDIILFSGQSDQLRGVSSYVAKWPGQIVPIVVVQYAQPSSWDNALAYMMTERATSINTAAAGGNASLMTLV